VRNRGTTIESLALVVVEEVGMVPVPEVGEVVEQVETGVHQSRLQPDGEAVSNLPYLHDASLTDQKRVLRLSLVIPAQVVSCLSRVGQC